MRGLFSKYYNNKTRRNRNLSCANGVASYSNSNCGSIEKKEGGNGRIELPTSRTLSENHTTRPITPAHHRCPLYEPVKPQIADSISKRTDFRRGQWWHALHGDAWPTVSHHSFLSEIKRFEPELYLLIDSNIDINAITVEFDRPQCKAKDGIFINCMAGSQNSPTSEMTKLNLIMSVTKSEKLNWNLLVSQ